MNCEICNKDILDNSQYINGKYYHNDCIEQLQQENARLKDKIDESIEYIRDCCDMDSKWVNLHYDYAQKEMSSNEVDRLLEILKEN